MTVEIIKLTGMAAILVALAAAPAVAEDASASWDADHDGALSKEEFVAGLHDRGIFDTWDVDRDESLSTGEFDDGVYGTFDKDKSGNLEEAEYGAMEGAGRFWSRDETTQDFEAWDIDGDGVILLTEFVDGWKQTDMFGKWDTDNDGSLSDDELTTGVFDKYDGDGSGVIEEPELTDIGDDMGDEGLWDV